MPGVGVELELAVLFVVLLVGSQTFAVFEIETPAWRLVLKWLVLAALTLGLYTAIGHWAAVVPVVLGGAGAMFHFAWCRKNGIDPLRATPRRRYYEIRGWEWPE